MHDRTLCLACGGREYVDVYSPCESVAITCACSGVLPPDYLDTDANGWLDNVKRLNAYWQLAPFKKPPTILMVHRLSRGRSVQAMKYFADPSEWLMLDGLTANQRARWIKRGSKTQYIKKQGTSYLHGRVPRLMSVHGSLAAPEHDNVLQQHSCLFNETWNAGLRAVNQNSISWELPAPKYNWRNPDEAYEDETIETFVNLVASFSTIVPSLRYAVGHDAVIRRPGRFDPGRAFPWEELQSLGLETVATPAEFALMSL